MNHPSHEDIHKVFDWASAFSEEAENVGEYCTIVAKRFNIADHDLAMVTDMLIDMYEQGMHGMMARPMPEYERVQAAKAMMRSLLVRMFSFGSELYQRHTFDTRTTEIGMAVHQITNLTVGD